MRAPASLLLAILLGASACRGAEPTPAPAPPVPVASSDDDPVGHPAPGWQLDRWYNSPPLTLESLRGSVVLVRWFMSPECPLCSATAPSLNILHERYRERGLVVIGMYHHKREEPLDPEAVRGFVAHYGFRFPVAIDDGWRTLRRWWLDGHEREYTSVSFLIDRRGVVRHVHRGGRYAPGDRDFEVMRAKIEALLAE